jgi:ribosomal protein S18 acetylase RimI-like enzyme
MIRDFTLQDYEAAAKLWKSSDNIGLSSADDSGNIERFLKRNPGMSKVAVEDGQIVGTILCGHDGRRGYLYHLCVDERYRGKGLGRRLVGTCLERLQQEGIGKCHLFIFGGNEPGSKFWQGTRWQKRGDIIVFSHNI